MIESQNRYAEQEKTINTLLKNNESWSRQGEKMHEQNKELLRLLDEARAVRSDVEKKSKDRKSRILTGLWVGLGVGVIMAVSIPSAPVAAVGTAACGVVGATVGNDWPKTKEKHVEPKIKKIKNVWKKVKNFF